MKETRIAIVPGSFDPITFGHIDLVKRALESFDKVYLAVMINPAKKYMFSIDERKRIAQAALEGIDNVEVISSEGMLWELALALDACAIVKGYRNDKDLEYEKSMAEFNEAHNPKAKTILLEAREELCELSSTMVREIISNQQSVEKYIPDGAVREIKKILSIL